MQFGTFLQPPTRAKASFLITFNSVLYFFIFLFGGYIHTVVRNSQIVLEFKPLPSMLHPIIKIGISYTLFSIEHFGFLRFFATRYGVGLDMDENVGVYVFLLFLFFNWKIRERLPRTCQWVPCTALCTGPIISLNSSICIEMCHTNGSCVLFKGPTNLTF